MTYLIFDLILVAVLLFFFWRGYKRGLILTLCSLLAVFVAFIGASIVSNALAEPVSHSIRPIVEQHLQQTFRDQIEQADSSADHSHPQQSSHEQDDPAALPLQDALELLKGTSLYRGFADAVQQAVDRGMIAASANAARVIADYISRQVAQMVLMVISFVLILILWFFFSHALDLTFHLPVLSTLNRWGGGLIGLCTGSLVVYVACFLLKGSFLPQQAMDSTYVLKFFCTVNPLTWLS